MHKLILSVIFCTCFCVSKAQLQEIETTGWTLVGQIKRVGTTIAKMEYKISGRDTLYNLLLKDFKRQQEVNYFSVGFKSEGSSFSRFYELLKSFFIAPNKKDKNYMKTFRLGSQSINLQHITIIGSKGVRLTSNDGYINLSEKDIDKIFGQK